MERKGWDLDLMDGERAEQHVSDLLKHRVEVKFDEKQHETGRIFLEYAQRGVPSGITVTQAAWWATVLVDGTVVLVTTQKMRALGARAWKEGRTKGGEGDRQSGVLVPCEWLLQPWAKDEPPEVSVLAEVAP